MKRTNAPVSVAILGINGADSPSPGLILSQCLRRQVSLPVRVIALVGNPFTDGIQAVNHADEVVVVPSPDALPHAFAERVGELARRLSPLVLLPGGTAEWLALIPLGRELQRKGVSLLFPPERLVNETFPFPARKKFGKGVEIPKGYVFEGRDLRPLFKMAWRFPVKLRAYDGTSAVAVTWEELELKIARYRLHSMAPLSIHEIVPGDEISVASLGDQRGRPVGWIAARVLSRSDNGAIWSAVTVNDPATAPIVTRLLSRIGWPGPLTLTLTVSPGHVSVTGIEPGFPGWVSLAVAAGLDLPLQYLRLALGTRVLQAPSYRAGLFLARVSVDQPTDVTALSRLVTQGACSDATDRSIDLRATADRATGARHHR